MQLTNVTIAYLFTHLTAPPQTHPHPQPHTQTHLDHSVVGLHCPHPGTQPMGCCAHAFDLVRHELWVLDVWLHKSTSKSEGV
jgi:hypothetical protein